MGYGAGIPADALRLDWQATEALSVELAEQVEVSGKRFDVLLALQRSGTFPANILARRFGMPANTVLSAGVTCYDTGATEGNTVFKQGQFPTASDVAGKTILIVDEVCDSGRTLKYVIDKLTKLGVKSVATAVLHYKPAKTITGHVPDFYAAITDKWIVYPWEWHEEAGLMSQVGQPARRTIAKATT